MSTRAILVQPFVFAVLQQVVETEQPAAQGVVQNPVVIVETQLEFGRNFVIFSVTAGFSFNRANGIADHARIAVDRTWRPVPLAHFIEHGAADSNARVRLETGAFAGVIFGRYLKQADHPGLDQVFDLDTGRQTRQQVVGNAFNQRRVTLDQLVLRITRRSLVEVVAAGCHRTGPAVCCTRRSTKNSRCPRGLAGSGQVSTFCAMALNASEHLERGKAS
ncbi:hypothetical protein D3C73_934340 [compost metagenome]